MTPFFNANDCAATLKKREFDEKGRSRLAAPFFIRIRETQNYSMDLPRIILTIAFKSLTSTFPGSSPSVSTILALPG